MKAGIAVLFTVLLLFGIPTSQLSDKDEAFYVESNTWAPVNVAGGELHEESRGLAIDSEGNSYITGCFWSQTVFFADIAKVKSTENRDLFVAKMNPFGEWLWVQTVGAGERACGSEMVLHNDTIYITGSISGTATFGDHQVTSNGGVDMYLAAISTDGDWLWALNAGGDEWDFSLDVDTDPAGDIYITGYLGSSADFGDIHVQSNYDDIVVAKASSEGEWLWAQSAGGNDRDVGRAIIADENGVFISGFFSSDSVQFDNDTVNNDGGKDSFIARLYSEGGGWAWAREIDSSGSTYEMGDSLEFDSNGDIHATGRFEMNGIDFADDFHLFGLGQYNIYHAKISPWGTWLSAEGIDDTYWGESNIAINSADEIYISSSTSADSIAGEAYVNNGSDDAFIVKITDDGMTLHSTFGGQHNEQIDDLVITDDGFVAVTGHFWSDPLRIGNHSFSNRGDSDADIFVLHLGESIDIDGDGIPDSRDGCPQVAGNSTIDVEGCPDSDGDGWSDDGDACPDDPEEWSDRDGDGVCDGNDVFPDDGTQWSDQDGDGYGDELDGYQGDSCPEIWGTSWSDRFGCPDSDGDGWSDLWDEENTPWNDSDDDGWFDHVDACPELAGNSSEERLGCPDSDGDGWSDLGDAFPEDPSQWSDFDGDGYGDNPIGTNADRCALRYGTSTIDRLGCPDSDEDGWSDPDQIHTIDNGADACMLTYGESSMYPYQGCMDSDGDGWPDHIDRYPLDNGLWSDGDGDGWADQSGSDLSDDCVLVYGESYIDLKGCPDKDGDGVSDINDFLPDDPEITTEEEFEERRTGQYWLFAGGGGVLLVLIAVGIISLRRGVKENKWK